MKKRGKRKGGSSSGQKPTKSDMAGRSKNDGPKPLTADQIRAKEREIFEARQKQALAKAAIELDEIDGAILRLLVFQPGITQEMIADYVGRTRQTVNERINAPKFQAALQRAMATSLEVFEQNKAKAARVLGALLDSKDERVQLRAAISHLWPMIHAEGGNSSSDFVAFIQEAYELAEAKRLAGGESGLTGPTGAESSPPAVVKTGA